MGLEGLSRRIISSNINKFLRMSQRRTLYSLLHAAAGNAAITRGVGRGQLLRLTARTVIMAMATRARPRPAVCLFQRPLVAAARSLGTISILLLRTVRSRVAVRLNNSSPVSDSSAAAAGASAVWVKSVVQRDIERNLTHAARKDHS